MLLLLSVGAGRRLLGRCEQSRTFRRVVVGREDLADEVRHPGGSCDSCPAVHLVAEHILLGRKIRPDAFPVIPARCDPVAHGRRTLLWRELAL